MSDRPDRAILSGQLRPGQLGDNLFRLRLPFGRLGVSHRVIVLWWENDDASEIQEEHKEKNEEVGEPDFVAPLATIWGQPYDCY